MKDGHDGHEDRPAPQADGPASAESDASEANSASPRLDTESDRNASRSPSPPPWLGMDLSGPPPPTKSKASAPAPSQRGAGGTATMAASQSGRETKPQEPPTQSQGDGNDSSSSSRATPQESNARPYGTRSRNKPGSTRPNYAEDTEMDFEVMVPAPPAKSTGNSARTSRSPPPVDSRNSPAPHVRRNPTTNGNASWQPVPKDSPIPGTSTFSVSNAPVAPTQGKKRKAVTKESTNGVPASYIPTQTNFRKSGTAPSPRGGRETNMLTFEKTQARLKDRSLEADDGTVVSVNGKLAIATSNTTPRDTNVSFNSILISLVQTIAISSVSRPGNLIIWVE